MAGKPRNPAGRKGRPLSFYPLTPDQAMRAVLAIKDDDVRRIVGRDRKEKKGKK
jgi:hypothetical protein